jgi:RNA polymerase sigma-70 factor (ECF subfamily)
MSSVDFPSDWLKSGAADANDVADMTAEVTQLMLATKHGDRIAFDRLVRRLRGRAFHIAHSLVGSRDDALDLAQETFLKVFGARETFSEGQPFLPWFHRILRNTCFSHLRKRGRLRQVSLSAGSDAEESGDWELLDEDAPAPSARMEGEERMTAFQDGLRRLSAKDREILVLRHYQDLSYREIAESLGVPQGTVMSRLFHARRRLRERLEGVLDEAPRAEADPS